jgi:Zn-dependent peptidase ImmA (M78 family)
MDPAEKLSIVNHFRNRMPPVDVKGLAFALGLKVHEAFLSDNTSGMIEPFADSYKITVNSNHSHTRKRFTVAHEIGHFILHRHLIGDGIADDRIYRSTDAEKYHNTAIGPHEETQANRFAAALLMPHESIEKARAEGCTEPSELAVKFGVSEQAMCIQLGVPYEPR